MARAPRPGAGKRAAQQQNVYKVTVDGTTHHLRLGEVTAAETGELRRLTGFGLRHLGYVILSDPDIDIIAAVVWLARRQVGERSLGLDQVARTITYDSEVEVDVVDHKQAEAEEPDSPEG
jgi:hypothetical protein